MTLPSVLAFTIGMVLLAIAPGAGVATVVSRTLGSGLRAGFAVMTGLIIGDMIFMGLAILGLSAIATTLGPLFQIVKYAGAAYLIWLGVQAFRHADRAVALEAAAAGAPWRDAAIGLLVTLGNPKPILFYGALMPTFFDVTTIGVGDYLILASISAAVTGVVLGGCAVLAHRARRFVASRRAARRLNQATGVTLLGSGVLVATR